jgi:hypothetical protein
LAPPKTLWNRRVWSCPNRRWSPVASHRRSRKFWTLPPRHCLYLFTGILVSYFSDLEDHSNRPPSISRAADLAANISSPVSSSPLLYDPLDIDPTTTFKTYTESV